MKIWVQFEANNIEFLKAVAGAVKGGVYFDGREIGPAAMAYVAQACADQGYHPVCRVNAALAMKKDHDGIAIIYGKNRLKSKPDMKTLLFEPDGSRTEGDKAIEAVLGFLKHHKVPSSV